MRVPSPFPAARSPALRTGLGAGLIVLAIGLAYSGSLRGPLVFDDLPAIAGNPTLRHLATAWRPVFGAQGSGLTVAGRPLLNLSYALNYAIGGLDVVSYHIANTAIHALAALTLFGIVRRSLRRPDPAWADFLAAATALLWALAPIQTEAVTYLSQRAESLAALFYLLTLYGFVRATATGGATRWWLAASALACWLGMATKEIVVTAPLMVLAFDVGFVAGSLRAAWRARAGYYVALAAAWGLLAWLVAGANHRGASAGFGSSADTLAYWAAQPIAVVRYLWLSLWGYPLVFNYGFERTWIAHPALPLALGLALVVLALACVVATLRKAWAGYLGLWFFAVLSATSVVPILRQTEAEHRMYLAFAPVALAVVLAIDRFIVRDGRRWLGIALCLGLASAALAGTLQRNLVYRTALSLWADTVAKRPENPWAQNNLGVALYEAGRNREALPHLLEAVRLNSPYAEGENNVGNTLDALGRVPEAIEHFQKAIAEEPGYREGHNGLGIAYAQQGRTAAAIAEFKEAVRLSPDYPETRNNLGLALSQLGRNDEAIEQFNEALRLRPAYPEAHNDLGLVLAARHDLAGAAQEFQAATASRPDYALAHFNLGLILRRLGQPDEAHRELGRAVELNPALAARIPVR